MADAAQHIQQGYLNIYSDNSLKEFNLNIMDFASQELYNLYSQIYFNSICLDPTDEVCQSLLSGTLNGGVISFSKYLHSTSPSEIVGLFPANVHYIEPAILSLLSMEQNFLVTIFSSSASLTSIFFYIYAVVTLLLFISLWLMYLRELNVGLNQTIQMLNMIPLKVLPNSNKETKRFIRWIIRESNKKKHEE